MIELPEALNIAGQINDTVYGKRIASATVAHTPHKMGWYYRDPMKYSDLLVGRAIGKATGYGSMVEIKAEKALISMGEGTGIRFHNREEPRPSKHHLLIEFTDGPAMSASIQMYGVIGSFLEGELDHPYYKAAKEKPSPISAEFDKSHFDRIISIREVQKLSLKALLATEQSIPGLGNGVLQDILFNAKMHPKRKVETLSEKDKEALYVSVKNTLSAMTSEGVRDTEPDLFGRPGGYKTVLCKNTVNKPCPVCGTAIKKEAYMGGSVYYCE